ncbi:hypothetical protein HKBW3S43_01446 [Candidatus Hakubella thermalkaliphila]|uniref:Uncharacterized protein n=1 Tax=Candidatus Hakubella thermalkaliphila TaxID=2754717 RepID=A0A6V8PTM6_9ACTN|nr:hypothetical protein [Candidatus Hakubella thermalkaliphila]GFP25910.1 hypothetical protein HKBW3S25_01394 [Candidatus Hakubella thermalkaliphila]GFP35657.1 hypothetical protein HKBW3S43_01446 [Candidatus Hakubella thermalkaliphila]GFP41249.1 hypothetical protein HKBW3C_00375 [Candidatus Hakubella thermalkaliphila]
MEPCRDAVAKYVIMLWGKEREEVHFRRQGAAHVEVGPIGQVFYDFLATDVANPLALGNWAERWGLGDFPDLAGEQEILEETIYCVFR